jgi:hypothetical protein
LGLESPPRLWASRGRLGHIGFLTVELFEIVIGKGHGGLSQNRTTKKPQRHTQLQAMGEAGGGLPGNSPSKTVHAGSGEISPPAFAASSLRSFSRSPFVFCFERDPRGLSHPFQNAQRLQELISMPEFFLLLRSSTREPRPERPVSLRCSALWA